MTGISVGMDSGTDSPAPRAAAFGAAAAALAFFLGRSSSSSLSCGARATRQQRRATAPRRLPRAVAGCARALLPLRAPLPLPLRARCCCGTHLVRVLVFILRVLVFVLLRPLYLLLLLALHGVALCPRHSSHCTVPEVTVDHVATNKTPSVTITAREYFNS